MGVNGGVLPRPERCQVYVPRMGYRGMLVVIALVAAVGCSSEGAAETTTTSSSTTTTTATTVAPGVEPAGDAVQRQFRYLSDGQYGRAYAEIHPSQQALFTAAQYDTCLSKGLPVEITSVTVTDEYEEQFKIPGTEETVDSTAVTVQVVSPGESFTDTFHEVLVDGAWRFTVGSPEIMADC